ncbi:sensor histidine kinase [Paenibacillus thermotolerans]|uniref:sensor histidine kinase n=1 Tax=Paenibacillus thermotolerans TaxID=3027807 RepID=UPI0023688E4D|nr:MULTISPECIES: sensor histidine kinase [unclassified Paenibacillus]
MGKISAYVDRAVFGLRTFWFLVQVAGIVNEHEKIDYFWGAFVWLLLAGFAPYLFWLPNRDKSRFWYCVTELSLTGSLFLYSIYLENSMTNVFFVPALVIGYLATKPFYRFVPIVFGLSLIAFLIGSLTFGQAFFGVTDTALFFGIGFVFRWLLNVQEKANRLMRTVEEQNATLKIYSEQVERLSKTEERIRIASDLHDTLGHSYISFILGLDASIALVDRSPEAAKKHMTELRQAAARQLDSMREIVHGLGEHTNITLSEELAGIAREFSESTGKRVSMQSSGRERHLQRQIHTVFIRCLQETLSNAVRHGKADSVNVSLGFDDECVRLKVEDDGIGMNGNKAGFGLTAMQERVGSVGGRLSIESETGKGTVITCSVPMKGEAVHV